MSRENEPNIRKIASLAGYMAGLAVFIMLFTGTVYALLKLGFKFDIKEDTTETLAVIPESRIINGKDSLTGLIADTGWEVVKTNCTGCHTSKIIVSNKMTAEGWTSAIRWMQKKQNLWDLGANEKIIVDYLAKNYAPTGAGRRKQLEVVWYDLK